MTRKAWLGLSFVFVGGAAAVVVACGDDDTNIAATDAGVDSSLSTPVDGGGNEPNEPADAASDAEEGEPVTDGGSNLDPDDGGDGDDAGADGGPCNQVKNEATAVQSACISLIPAFGGGTLVAGRYYLTAVNDIGAANFCQNRFVSTGLKETMELTVDSQGVGTANTVTIIGSGGNRRRTATFAPGTAVASMEITSTCPAGAPATDEYSSGMRNGKQTIRVRLPYGQGTAVYVFEKQ